MADQRGQHGTQDDPDRGGLYRLALRLGPLLEPAEAVRGALEACAELAGADTGLLLAEGLPPAALGVPEPSPAEARAIAATPPVRAAAELLGVSALPPGAAPLPGPALVAAGLHGPAGPQGVLLLGRAGAPAFERTPRTALAAAMPLVAQALERARRHGAMRNAGHARDAAVGRLAHDIRSPLVATHASIDVVQRLLRDQPVPRPVFDALATGMRSVQAAVELCNDLLEVSRLQNGFAIVARPVPVERLVADTCQMLRPVADQQHVALEADGLGPGLRIAGDERLLRRLLTNLVANALRFAPAGGFVRVEGLPGDEPGTILLRVSDNGPGIPPADQERVFLAFAQGAGEQARGTGLGLALCREVAHAHGGQIWAEDRPGGGTRLVVKLPEG
jgi:signal transduction histidine kinase